MVTQAILIHRTDCGNAHLDSLIYSVAWVGINTPNRFRFGSGTFVTALSSSILFIIAVVM